MAAMFSLNMSANAETIAKTLSKHHIDKDTISISVKDIKNGNTVYELNSKHLQNPASTLKIVTYTAALDNLGCDYEFKTSLYKSINNDLYLKLGADPYLMSRDLKDLFAVAKNKKILEPKNIYIDESVFDKNEWGEGWQWDDDLNPLMPKYSAYNLDKNFLGIVINPTQNGAPAEIYTENFYPVTFMNFATTGKENDIKITRNNNIAPDMLKIEGTIAKRKTFYIPNNNPQRYFKLRLEEFVRESKIEYYKDLKNQKLPSKGIYLVSEVTHPMKDAAGDVLKNSNNYVAETVFKLAGANFSKQTGTIDNSMKMLDNYLAKIGVQKENIRITDGSGVSKNNLVTSDFMTDFLVAQSRYGNFEEYLELLPKPGEGTLKNRMLYFQDNLHAKTGTLSDISTITGYITTKKGKTYAFNIMITDPKTSSADKKDIEEFILRSIYTTY